MSHGSIFLQTMSRSGFAEKNNARGTEAHHPKPKNDGDHCMESTGISFTRHTSKGQHIYAEWYRANILTGLLLLRPQVDGNRLVVHGDNTRPQPPENAELFAKKIGSASPYTHRTHLTSPHPTPFSSDISNILRRESLFHHVKNYLHQFMKS
jgi:hypothetical protein